MLRKWRSAILAFVLFSSHVLADESEYVCHPEKFNLSDVEGTYAYGQDYEHYEYSFRYLTEYWVVALYRFFQLPSSNPILKDITPDDKENEILQKIVNNAEKAIKESSIANSISDSRIYSIDQGDIVIFDAESDFGKQRYSFLVDKMGDELRVYRTFYIFDERNDMQASDDAVSSVVQELVKSCQSDVI